MAKSSAAAPLQPATQAGGNWDGGRLTSAVLPDLYQLAISVDPSAERFSGQVKLSAQAAREVNILTLHSLKLDIREVRINGRTLDIAKVSTDESTETITLVLDEPLKPGLVSIEIVYEGRLNKQMQGFYLSTAKSKGKEEKYAFTQFEPTDARRMFPCFDEPDLKARFALTVTAPDHLQVLSNMPATGEKSASGLKTVTFGETPRMSTYLLALAAARIKGSAPVKTAGTQLRVWARPEELKLADFSKDIGAEGLKKLADYFDVPYPLPKMDLLAVPDFSSGAMENWGAVYFRDSAMLADPKSASTNALRRIGVVVVHEFVHQWFGNLVTMKWWNDLWLNEAFATWVSYKITDRLKPEWRLWFEFEDGKAEPLRLDSLKNARPIMSPASTSAEIEAQFDAMSYQKGAAILNMLENYLGEENFRKGIHIYLTRHQYANAEAADFWSALKEASGSPVADIAQDWLIQTGYPLVRVEADGLRLKLGQIHFSAYGPGADKKFWNVPMVIAYQLKGESKTRTHRVLLSKAGAAMETTLPGKGELLWLYPNQGQSGYYRVFLAPKLMAGLRDKAGSKLGALERMGLLSDLWAQVRNGTLPIADFMDSLMAFGKGDARPVIEALAGYLAAMHDVLDLSTEDRKRLGALAEALLRPHWKRLGWRGKAGEDDEAKLSRAAVLGALGKVAKTPSLLAEAEKRLQKYLKDPASLDPTLVGTVLFMAARSGDAKRFEAFAARMKSAGTPQDRDRFMGALAEFDQPGLAEKLMAMGLSDDIRGQDAWRPVAQLLLNREAQSEAWDFLKAHWKELRDKVGSKGSNRVVGATSLMLSRAWLKDVEAFFTRPENRVPEAERTLKLTLEKIELNLKLRETQSAGLAAWLKAR